MKKDARSKLFSQLAREALSTIPVIFATTQRIHSAPKNTCTVFFLVCDFPLRTVTVTILVVLALLDGHQSCVFFIFCIVF